MKTKYEIALEACIKNRKKHYPPIEDVVSAMFEGFGEEMDRIKALRADVKAKFPKPNPIDYPIEDAGSTPMEKAVKKVKSKTKEV